MFLPFYLRVQGSVAEWSKALDSSSSLFGGVGSNPTWTTPVFYVRKHLFEQQDKTPENSLGIEPREMFKTVHSCQFLFKLLGRNARNSFKSFEIELSARIFLKRRWKIQKSLTKRVIFGENRKNLVNQGFLQNFLLFLVPLFENPRRQFDFKWLETVSRVSPDQFEQKLTAVDNFEHFSKFKIGCFQLDSILRPLHCYTLPTCNRTYLQGKSLISRLAYQTSHCSFYPTAQLFHYPKLFACEKVSFALFSLNKLCTLFFPLLQCGSSHTGRLA